jgi:predicted nucleic acid-binding protein
MGGRLIDTDVFIQHERRRLAVGDLIERWPDDSLLLSVITVSELLHGAQRAADPARAAWRSAFVEAIVAAIGVQDIDLRIARTHAQLSAELAATGRSVGAHDVWLAATCVSHGLTLVTTNPRELSRVPGLRWEVWAPA